MIEPISLINASTVQAMIEATEDDHYGGRVHHDFEVVEGPGCRDKDIYAENFGNRDLFVRIQLREFLQIGNNPAIGGADISDPSTWLIFNSIATDVHVRRGSPSYSEAIGNEGIEWTLGHGDGMNKWFMPTHNHATRPVAPGDIWANVPVPFNDPFAYRFSNTTGGGREQIAGGFNIADQERAEDIHNNGFITGPSVSDGTHDFWSEGDTYTRDLIYINGVGQGAFPPAWHIDSTIHGGRRMAGASRFWRIDDETIFPVGWVSFGQGAFSPAWDIDDANYGGRLPADRFFMGDQESAEDIHNNGTHEFWSDGNSNTRDLIYINEDGQLSVRPGVTHVAQQTLIPDAGGVMTLTQWNAAGQPAGNFWILDSENPGGWFYWNGYLPAGEATSLLLNGICIEDRSESWQYVIFMNADFFARDSLDDLPNLSIDAREIFPPIPGITLRELIAEAEARIQANYAPRSWGDMQSMLTFARSVYNNPNLQDAQYDEAVVLLRARLDALVLR